jgi:DNA-binding transcriptional ArsR family regulator
VVSLGWLKEVFDLAKRVLKRVCNEAVRMSSLLPIRSEPSTGDDEPRVVDLDGEEADEVFSALSSSTAREIVAVLHDEPRTQSGIAEELDTTVQNVRYHLDKLENAGLVEVVDTWYSSRGNEMSVFAPADGALIVAGNDRQRSRIRTALSRLVGGVTVVGLASLLVQRLLGRSPPSGTEEAPSSGDGGAGDDDAGGGPEVADQDGTAKAPDAGSVDANVTGEGQDASAFGNGSLRSNTTVETTSTAEPTTTVEPTTVAEATSAADPGVAGGLPPGLLFFLGGVSVLLVVVAYWSGR